MAGSKGVVIAAMFANGGIAVLKFIGYLLTGSPSMLAESYHSVSDTGNQVLLLIGIRYSGREANRVHPYGHGKAQFFYAFLVSVLLFGVAGWESFKHGFNKLQAGGHEAESGAVELLWLTIDVQTPVDPFWISVTILLGAIGFESWAFLKARAELLRQMEEYDWSGYREAFKKTSDLPTLTAFTEDTIALLGLVVALVGISASRITHNPAFDALGALLIGILLMLFAGALAIENKRLLVGESLPADVEADLKSLIADHEGVRHLDDLRSMFIGAGRVLVTADVSFETGLDTETIDDHVESIEGQLKERENRIALVYIEPEL